MKKYVRFLSDNRPLYGLVEGNDVYAIDGDILGSFRVTDRRLALEDLHITVPVRPSQVLALGLNYRAHAGEINKEAPEWPLVFLKSPNSLIAHGEPIVLPPESKMVHYEAELVVVIKDLTCKVSEGEALSHVLGYCCGNDVSARDIQRREGQFSRAKSFDTFGPVGPFIVADIDPSNLHMELRVNGEIRQSASTSDLVHGVSKIISFASQSMTLYPGDMIFTGTPSGIGELKSGDTVEVEIETIGLLRNPVVAERVG